MHCPDACACQHRNKSLWHHRQVDHHTIAFANPMGLQRSGKPLHLHRKQNETRKKLIGRDG